MGVTGSSSECVAEHLKNDYFCIMPTSTVYCVNQRYVSKSDEIRQIEDFLAKNGVSRARFEPHQALKPSFSRFLANSHLKYGKYVGVRLYQKSSKNTSLRCYAF